MSFRNLRKRKTKQIVLSESSDSSDEEREGHSSSEGGVKGKMKKDGAFSTEQEDDSSSSDSSVENYLRPANEIDLDSSFFTSEKIDGGTMQKEAFKVGRLSSSDDSGSENKDEPQEEKEEHVKIERKSFESLENYHKKLEETKKAVETYKNRKIKEEKVDIKKLLSVGEAQVGDKLESSYMSGSSDDEMDWDDIERENEVSQATKEIPREGVSIIIAPQQAAARKKKQDDYLMQVRRRLNRIRKENQVFMHKVHLLCWIAHGNYVNSTLNSQNILGLCLSLIPNKNCYPPVRADLKYLEQITKWYSKNLKVVEKISERIPTMSLERILQLQIAKKEANSKKNYVLIFIGILRALGLQCRLILSLRPLPLKPPQSELCSLSTKDKNQPNKSNNKSDTNQPSTLKVSSDKNTKKNINETKKNSANIQKEDVTKSKSTKTETNKSKKGEKEENKVSKEILKDGKKSPRPRSHSTKTIDFKEKQDTTKQNSQSSKDNKKGFKEDLEDNKDPKEKTDEQDKKSLRYRRTKSLDNKEKLDTNIDKMDQPPKDEKKTTKDSKVLEDKLEEYKKHQKSSRSRRTIKPVNYEERSESSPEKRRKEEPKEVIKNDDAAEKKTTSAKGEPTTRRSLKLIKPELQNKETSSEMGQSTHNSIKNEDPSEDKSDSRIGNSKKATGKTEEAISSRSRKSIEKEEESSAGSKKSLKPRSSSSRKETSSLKVEDKKPRSKSSSTLEVPKPTNSPTKTKLIGKSTLDLSSYGSEDEFKPDRRSLNSFQTSFSPKNNFKNDIINILKGDMLRNKQTQRSKLVRKKSTYSDNSDSDYMPEPEKKPRRSDSGDEFKETKPKKGTVTKVKQRVKPKSVLEREEKLKLEKSKSRVVDRRVLSSDDEAGGPTKKEKEKIGNDVWCEVFLEAEEKWISVDVIKGQVHCVSELNSRASTPITYVLAWSNNFSLKDVTSRYCPHMNTVTRKLRVDANWWTKTLKPFLGRKSPHDKEEDEDLARQQLEQPLPKTIMEYKNHPLYALKRHLLKFEALYPPDSVTLGFVRNEPVYARECVHTLHSREIWIKHAKVVRLGEQPYKIVKARPKYDKLSGQVITDQPLEIFGPWQVDDYVPPNAENGVVPRNAYGNVELFKPCMLPGGTVHLQLPGLNKICRRLQIDCAPALVGFEFHSGGTHPTYDGFVVCEEYEDQLIQAWEDEQEEIVRREREKIEKRVYDNWKKLIKGLLIREKLKHKYGFETATGSGKGKKKPKGPRFVAKKRRVVSGSDSST